MDRRTRKSKQALKDALTKLMHIKKVSQISVSELCELADLNRSTFYANYSHIIDLLTDIHRDLFEAMMKNTKAIHAEEEEIIIREKVITEMVEYIYKYRNEVTILFTNNENNLFEKNMLHFFMKAYNYGHYGYKIDYPFIYHTLGFFTLIQAWANDNYPCSTSELANIINEQSIQIMKLYTKK